MFNSIKFYTLSFTVLVFGIVQGELSSISAPLSCNSDCKESSNQEITRFNKVAGVGLARLMFDLNHNRSIPFIDPESFISAFSSDSHHCMEIADPEIQKYIDDEGSLDLAQRQRISYAFGQNILRKLQSSNCTYIDISIIRKQFRESFEHYKVSQYYGDIFSQYRHTYNDLITPEFDRAIREIVHKKKTS